MSARIGVDILIVNSDPAIDSQLQKLLEQQGQRVQAAPGVPEALLLLERQRFDLLIVDCELLELSGAALFRSLGRMAHQPLILPTSHLLANSQPLNSQWESLHDVAAQVQRLLSQPPDEALRVGDLIIDTAGKRVFFRGQRVWLPPIQFRLLAYLARNAGRVIGAQELLRAVWGYEEDETEARELVKVHVRQIRRRLGLGVRDSDLVQSVRGFGYTMPSPQL